jgi:DMSO/TMAO reductase YedYZ molybdopterin-dependent catalytic subunit
VPESEPVALEGFRVEELQLAARNHGMPLEALRYDVTPVGLHYLLTHYDIPLVQVDSWRLRVGGLVARPLELSLDELRARPAAEVLATMECAGNGRARFEPRPFSQPWLDEAVGTARWRGVALRGLLEEAGLSDTAAEVVFTGLDRGVEGGAEQPFERSLPLEDALRDEVLLAYEVNGMPLPPQHGSPLRLVVPGWYGMTNVKWLERVTAVDTPFSGYQQLSAYRFKLDEDDEGRPLSRMAPRALMVPPGVPDFPERRRIMSLGPWTLEGRAWSGWAPIAAVEVSADGGGSWQAAQVRPAESRWAWSGWTHDWEPPTSGQYELLCRAIDEAGNAQPLAADWNVGGYANNAVQRVLVTVVD